MPNKLASTLTSIGLSEKEAMVYLATLSLGSSNVQEIANLAGVKRTTVYSVLRSLKSRGLVHIELRGWKTLYVAERPEKLELMIDQMKDQIKNDLPDFLALYNLHSSGSFIKYYEGWAGVKNVYEDLLRDIRPHEDYLVIGEMVQLFNQDQNFFSNFIRRRAKKNINIRILTQDSAIAREHKIIEKKFNETIKIMPSDYKFTTNMVIIPHRVMIHQLTPPIMAIVIENDNVVKTNKELFEMIWQSIS